MDDCEVKRDGRIRPFEESRLSLLLSEDAVILLWPESLLGSGFERNDRLNWFTFFILVLLNNC